MMILQQKVVVVLLLVFVWDGSCIGPRVNAFTVGPFVLSLCTLPVRSSSRTAPTTSIEFSSSCSTRLPSKLFTVSHQQQEQEQLQVDNDQKVDELLVMVADNNAYNGSNEWHQQHMIEIETMNGSGQKSNNTDYEALIGCIALITGTTIGAGILALPTVTYTSGFVTSTMALLYGYIIMTLSGLYIAELTIRIAQETLPSSVVPDGNNDELHLHHELAVSTTITTTPSSTPSSLGLLDLYNQGMMRQATAPSQ